ncbi:MAG: hypothetical protein RL711_601 [Bacteroidota bacterium]|jgi:hypothetical protein
MNLRDIASVSGKSGLFRVLKPTRTGVILESIDSQKVKLVANANSKVSILKEISIYTTSAEGNVMLEEVFVKIHSKHGLTLPIAPKAANEELKAFLGTIIPDFDSDRVYPSDIKKLVSWYTILATGLPEVFDASTEEVTAAHSEEQPKTENAKATKASKTAKPVAASKAKTAKPAPAKSVKTIQSSKRGA